MSTKHEHIQEALEDFAELHEVHSKGSLSLVLVLSRRFHNAGLPIDPDDHLTPKGGQVRGLSGSSIQRILADHGISRKLTSEGGRTNRGAMEKMRAYASLCNAFVSLNEGDWSYIERFWIERVKRFFASQPIRIPGDRSLALQEVVRKALNEARERQRQSPGSMYEGAVLQHLVGAKLSLAAPDAGIAHHPVSQADEGTNRAGDFVVHETAVHVSISPSKELMAKCRRNLEGGMRCVVVTAGEGVSAAKLFAEQANIDSRIDIWEVGQFISTNISEWSGFTEEKRRPELERLLAVYNELVERHEHDPSLKLEFN